MRTRLRSTISRSERGAPRVSYLDVFPVCIVLTDHLSHRTFPPQLALATKHDLPLFLHSRLYLDSPLWSAFTRCRPLLYRYTRSCSSRADRPRQLHRNQRMFSQYCSEPFRRSIAPTQVTQIDSPRCKARSSHAKLQTAWAAGQLNNRKEVTEDGEEKLIGLAIQTGKGTRGTRKSGKMK